MPRLPRSERSQVQHIAERRGARTMTSAHGPGRSAAVGVLTAVEPSPAKPRGLRAHAPATPNGTTWSVEIVVEDKLIRRYCAPFERAAMALAKEVLRRLSPGAGFRVSVQHGNATLQSWSATENGWKASGPLPPAPPPV